ncbi:MAG: mandelate racemase/muconate lactonizing enzyme family protein [Verrucomicrobia bacterium]|nr:mandelate racemase/muconate lactonizing enzyme family protein [Verrucomicrobiota bacterium]
MSNPHQVTPQIIENDMNRRHFLASVPVLTAGCAALVASGSASALNQDSCERKARILSAAALPAIRSDQLSTDALIIESVELLRNNRQWLVRVRTKCGVEGLAVAHGGVLAQTYPIFTGSVARHAVGTDARDWENTLNTIYNGRGGFGPNYKWQGLALWVSVASLELAVLDLLGKAAGKPVTDILGEGTLRREIDVYHASSNRGNAPEAEIEVFRRFIDEFGTKAIKYRLGARMRQTEQSDARDRELIPLMRDSFPNHTLYADANGSYDYESSVRFGKMLSETGHSFFEEPVPFDHYDETLAVRKALEDTMVIAGGEQEISLRHFLWQIEHRIVDLPQPDIFYFGGLTRSIRVARAAHAVGMACTAHISGWGLGSYYAAVFAACTHNPGPYQEYKGFERDLPAAASSGRLIAKNGVLVVPDGPGLGVDLDPAWVKDCEIV